MICENGRFLHIREWPFNHAVTGVDRDCNETEMHAQLSATTYGEYKQRQATACDLSESLDQDLDTDYLKNTEKGKIRLIVIMYKQ